jgi:hypothetical protein
MEREQIVRDDFPTVRKGWDPAAVRSHLESIAFAVESAEADAPPPVARATSERVETVLAAAEGAAEQIVADARLEADRLIGAAEAEADQIRAAARTESKETVEAANEEAKGRVEQAKGAVEGLIAQADKLRSQVGALGREITTAPDDDDGAEAAAEPELPEVGPATDEELIEQLRSAAEGVPDEEPEPAPAVSGSDDGAARLVAMNMALEGASREEIEKQLTAEFGDVSDAEQLLDDVFRRAGK